MHYLLLLVAFVLLLGGAVLFTNAVEWAGIRLELGTGAVGSILAAVATALPESVIPILAILSGGGAEQIAVGSILGAPFLLATLAMLLVGISTHVFAGRRDQDTRLEVHGATTARDLGIVVVSLTAAAILGVVGNQTTRVIAAVLFVCCYAGYVWLTIRHGGEEGDEPKGLYFDPTKGDPPSNWAIIGQFVAGVGAIVGGAELFVRQIEHIAEAAGISALVLALIIAPLATELPEKVNSFFWVREGKDALALGNITGAMVFQSCIPTAIGIALAADAWKVSPDSFLSFASAGIAFASTAFIFLPMVRRGSLSGKHLLVGGLFYVLYVLIVVARLAGVF